MNVLFNKFSVGICALFIILSFMIQGSFASEILDLNSDDAQSEQRTSLNGGVVPAEDIEQGGLLADGAQGHVANSDGEAYDDGSFSIDMETAPGNGHGWRDEIEGTRADNYMRCGVNTLYVIGVSAIVLGVVSDFAVPAFSYMAQNAPEASQAVWVRASLLSYAVRSSFLVLGGSAFKAASSMEKRARDFAARQRRDD